MKCLIKKCDREANSRGLCFGCYSNAQSLIKTGSVAWEDLEKAGMSLPTKKRRMGNLFKEQLIELQKEGI